MTIKVAEMTSTLTMDSSRFRTSINQAGKAIVSFGTVAVTAASAAIGALTVREFEAIDATAKLSQQLGIADDTIRAWRLGVGLAGESFETLQKALRKLPRAIGQANFGLATQKRAFEELGLETERLAQLDAEEQFLQVADAVSKMSDKTKQAAVIADVFGRSGQQLLVFFKDGRAGIEALRRENERLNGSFSDLDAARVEELNDSVLKLTTAFRSNFKVLAVEVAPFLTSFVNKATNAIVDFRQNTLPLVIEWAGQFGRTIADSIIKWGPLILQFGKTVFSGLKFVFNGILDFVKLVGSGISSLSSIFGNTGKNALTLGEAVQEGLIIAEFAFQSFGTIADNVALRVLLTWEKVIAGLMAGFDILKLTAASAFDLIKGNVSFEDILDTARQGEGFQDSLFNINQLEDQLNKSNDKLITDFSKFRDQRINEIENTGKFFENLFDFSGLKLPSINEGQRIIDPIERASASRNRNFGLRGIERGSQEAFNIISQFEARTQSAEQKNLRLQEEQKEIQGEQLKELKKIEKQQKATSGPSITIEGFGA